MIVRRGGISMLRLCKIVLWKGWCWWEDDRFFDVCLFIFNCYLGDVGNVGIYYVLMCIEWELRECFDLLCLW